ncbi:MAG: hydrogenase [Acidobacteria bacterium]|nr:MAG: hydrogenase [Acidobacteriota bacterium]PYR43289.1 MAG: hydrogenase [Acidobacteriota bacterium]
MTPSALAPVSPQKPRPAPRLVQPWIAADVSARRITDEVMHPLISRPGAAWLASFALAVLALAVGVASVAYEVATGVGVWGLNKTVGWAFDITNFVFWIGIGHAGTLISAILLLLRQQWRTSISRSAEAMTIFAVLCAAVFPLIHMGRPWLAFWVIPYPNSRGPLWVNFRSPLLWDVFAINTYLTISLVFWYLGMIPDFATLRDRTAAGSRRLVYSLLSFGWNGSARTWSRYETATTILAGLATPLVISVHTIVSMDFATSVLPGWHSTVFPPYFVAGAVFSGFGMVLTLLIITRTVMHLEHYISIRHLEVMAKVMLLTGSIVGLAYALEFFNAWYGGNVYERYAFVNRASGPYAWCFWIMVLCNVLAPQLLWIRRVRRSVAALFLLSIMVNIGMWFERFVIIVTSLHRSYLPSSWTMYRPTIIEVGTLVGSFGLFFTCFLAFIRVLPMIAMWEVKAVTGHASETTHE